MPGSAGVPGLDGLQHGLDGFLGQPGDHQIQPAFPQGGAAEPGQLVANGHDMAGQGLGQSELWWRQFCYELRLGGYDDVLSIEHEDMTLSRYEGVKKSVELRRRCMPVDVSDYELPPI